MPVFLALFVACGPPQSDGMTLLSPREQLIRASVDLLGVHPSEQELENVDADPGLYTAYVDQYLHEDRFLDRMEEVYNVRFRMRTGETYRLLDNMTLDGLTDTQVADAIAEEPLQLIRNVIANDEPYTEVVRADYTMADPVLAKLWNLDYPADGKGWQKAHYRDNRPERGVLTMTSMWTRYPSAGVNANRARANALSRTLLCDDYLARPVSFQRSQIDALTGGDPQDIINSTPVCQSCHSSLDPLAGHFYGFWWERDGGLSDQTTYRPEDEELWRDYSGKPPGYFGHPDMGMDDLSDKISTDDRFVDCAVRTVYDGLMERDSTDEDWATLQGHRQKFVDSGLVVRDLVRSIVTSPEYLSRDTTDPTLSDRFVGTKTVLPSQLFGVIESITGYRWTFGGRDAAMDLDLVVLGGGVDGQYVTTPSYDPSVGLVFLQERLAQAASEKVASHDLDANRTDDAILLKYVSPTDDPDSNPDAFAAQIRYLYLRATGLPMAADAPEIAEDVALWRQLYSVEASSTDAWAGVVSVVLRDPRVLLY